MQNMLILMAEAILLARQICGAMFDCPGVRYPQMTQMPAKVF
jgi:hypothetical protein